MMIFFLSFSFLAFILSFCSGAPISIIKEQLELLDAESNSAPKSSPNDIIYLYSILYHRFIHFAPHLQNDLPECISSKFHLILLRYHKVFNDLFTESPIKCLQTVRIYSFELAFFFAEYITINAEVPHLSDLKYPLVYITDTDDESSIPEKIKNYILYLYENIAEKLVLAPFVAPTPRTNLTDSIIQGPYSAVHDWEGRKKILGEIIRMFKNVHEKSFDSKIVKKALEKILKYEFLIKEFQVDENGPCTDRFINTFRHLRSLPEKSIDSTKVFFLLEIYREHLINYHFTDPSVFPKEMLVIVCQTNFEKEEIFKLFKLPNEILLQDSIEDLRRYRMKEIYKLKEIQRPSFELANYKGHWHNLLNHKDGVVISKVENLGDGFTPKQENLEINTVLTPKEDLVNDISSKNENHKIVTRKKRRLGCVLTAKEEWFVKVYLTLSSMDLSIDLPSLKYLLDKCYTQFVNAPYSVSYFNFSFSTLKHFFSCFQTFLARNPDGQHSNEITQMHSILLSYYNCCRNHFSDSPLEFLREIRRNKGYELAYLFSYYAADQDDQSFDYLKKPLEEILKCNEANSLRMLAYRIFTFYKLIAEQILLKPFRSFTDQTSYFIAEWKMRKRFISEIIYTLTDLSKLSGNPKVDELIKEKIKEYEFIKREFQVNGEGPSIKHSVQIFRQLQSKINQGNSYEKISPNTKNLLTVFEIYYQNLCKWQFTDPSLFPKSMLAIISHQNLTKKKIFELFKVPIEERLQKAVKSLELVQIEGISSRVKSLGTNFISVESSDLSFRLELCHYLVNLKDVLTPSEDWNVKVYLALLND
jgi:hypothetical protein